MMGAPQVWLWLTTRWCPLPPPLSGLWWRALSKSRWSAASEWREELLDFDRPDRVVSSDIVERFLEESATPRQLLDVLAALMEEGKLLRRDAHQLEELVLRHVGKNGQWKHQMRQKGVA